MREQLHTEFRKFDTGQISKAAFENKLFNVSQTHMIDRVGAGDRGTADGDLPRSDEEAGGQPEAVKH